MPVVPISLDYTAKKAAHTTNDGKYFDGIIK